MHALQGDLTRSLEGLLNLEKQARVAEDVTASKAACSAVLEVCHKAKDLKPLEEHIVLLAKRRGQLKQVRDSEAGQSASIAALFLLVAAFCRYQAADTGVCVLGCTPSGVTAVVFL
jgi:hypothetical protein